MIRRITLLLLLLVAAAAPSVQGQLCPEPVTLKSEAGHRLHEAELDGNFLNVRTLCENTALEDVTAFTWPAPAAGFFKSTSGGAVSLASIAVADLPTGIPDANVSNSLTVDLAGGGTVTGGTPSKCARWDGSGTLVAHSSDCGAGGGGSQWTTVFKTANQTRDFTSTFADDTHLTFTVAASTTYAVRGDIFFQTTSGADIKFQFTSPSTTFARLDHLDHPGGTFSFSTSTIPSSITGPIPIDGTGAQGSVSFKLIFTVGASGGAVHLQWAQSNGGAGGPTTVFVGSYLEYAIVQ